MSDWSPDQYERFHAERAAPFFDLVSLLRAVPAPRVVDLGCGTGELTAHLHRATGARETLGLDSSAAMLERADPSVPGLRFERRDIAAFEGLACWDIVASNAALQWVPDHPALFSRLARALAPGGQLAVQVPANHDHPSHTLAYDLSGEEPFRSALSEPVPHSPVLPPEDYAVLLHALGLAEQHVRLQVYTHLLPGPEDVVEWVKGTKLTAFEQRLPAASWPAFLTAYRERLLAVLPAQRPHVYPFKRILLWGRR